MKLLKNKILVTVCFGLFSGCLMFAHAQAGAEARAEKRATAMVKQLGLSAEQKAKVAEIFTEAIAKSDEVKQANMAPAERRKANQAMNKKRDQGLKETLSAEQWEKLMEIRKRQRERQQAKKQQ